MSSVPILGDQRQLRCNREREILAGGNGNYARESRPTIRDANYLGFDGFEKSLVDFTEPSSLNQVHVPT